MIPEV